MVSTDIGQFVAIVCLSFIPSNSGSPVFAGLIRKTFRRDNERRDATDALGLLGSTVLLSLCFILFLHCWVFSLFLAVNVRLVSLERVAAVDGSKLSPSPLHAFVTRFFILQFPFFDSTTFLSFCFVVRAQFWSLSHTLLGNAVHIEALTPGPGIVRLLRGIVLAGGDFAIVV